MASLVLWVGGSKDPSGIGLKIRKHLLRWNGTANYSVDMGCAHVDSVSKPATVVANAENGFEGGCLGFFVQNPRRFLQVDSPISLAEGIASQYRTAKSAMFFIHPTLFRTWKVGAVSRKSE
jgi:hypothetical protein